MNENLKKEMLKSIEITRDTAKNIMEVQLEGYIEIISRLNLMSYLISSEEKK